MEVNMKGSRITILMVILALVVGESECLKRVNLEQKLPYTFQNVFDSGYLTGNLMNNAVVTDYQRMGVPAQYWKVTKAWMSTQFMIKPASAGKAQVSLSVAKQGPHQYLTKIEPYSLGLSGTLYWNVLKVKDPNNNNHFSYYYYLIQNSSTGLCLESRGAGFPVGVSDCNVANPKQLWAIRHENPQIFSGNYPQQNPQQPFGK